MPPLAAGISAVVGLAGAVGGAVLSAGGAILGGLGGMASTVLESGETLGQIAAGGSSFFKSPSDWKKAAPPVGNVQLTSAQTQPQSQTSSIHTLAELLEKKRQQTRQVFTLPAAKSYTMVQQINLLIE